MLLKKINGNTVGSRFTFIALMCYGLTENQLCPSQTSSGIAGSFSSIDKSTGAPGGDWCMNESVDNDFIEKAEKFVDTNYKSIMPDK